MTRPLHFGLLLMALLGLIGQSTAMAMAPARVVGSSSNDMVAASMAGMDCQDMSRAPASDTAPCKKITLQCIAAMGCSPMAFTAPVTQATEALPAHRENSAAPLMARLHGLSYGPEPEPPAILI